MTLAEIVRNLPSSEFVRNLPASRDLFNSAVLALRPAPRRSLAGHAGSLGLGLALGAGIALLCAPKAGRELRRQLSDRFDGVVHPQRLKQGERDERQSSSYARPQ
jgi:hypothetical protein